MSVVEGGAVSKGSASRLLRIPALQAGPGVGFGLEGADRLATFRAGEYAVEVVATAGVALQDRWPGIAGVIGIAPVHDAEHDRVQVDALAGQAVFVAQGFSW